MSISCVLRYTVPNPAYSKSAAKQSAAAAAQAGKEGSTKGDLEKAVPPHHAPTKNLAAQEKLELLKGITGYNEPGVLMALMGGSGAGACCGGAVLQ